MEKKPPMKNNMAKVEKLKFSIKVETNNPELVMTKAISPISFIIINSSIKWCV